METSNLKRKIRVKFLLSNIFKYGGVQRAVSNVLNHLAEKDYFNVEVISIFKTSEEPCYYLDPKIKVNSIFSNSFDLRKNFIKVLIGIRSLLKDKDTDILVYSGMGYSSIIHLATMFLPHICTIGWEHQNYRVGKIFGLEWLGRKIALASDCRIIVQTKEDKKDYSAKSIVGKVVYIPQSIDIKQVLCEYSLDSKVIVSCGSLVPQKGYKYLLEVAKILLNRYKDWKWHIYGEGQERERIEKLIDEYGLKNQLILKGAVKDPYQFYGDYSFFVMTSISEGFGLALLEARSCSLPMISFDCPNGPSEIIDEGVNGFLVPCYDVAKMVKRAEYLIENREIRKKLSDSCKLGITKFDIAYRIQKWIDVIIETNNYCPLFKNRKCD